ncbi:MAG: hypothetical protein ACK42I_00175 [Thermomicrobium sp.]
MRIAALVFGILGGLVGLVAAFLALGIGGLAAAFAAEGAGTVIGGGLGAVLFAALGIVGGALALSRPGVSAILQLIAALGGLVAIWLFWIPSAALFGLGALTAVLGRRSGQTPTTM